MRTVWWGGLLGAKLLKLAKCNKCGAVYGGESGKSHSKTGIYVFAGLAVVIGTIATVQKLVGLF